MQNRVGRNRHFRRARTMDAGRMTDEMDRHTGRGDRACHVTEHPLAQVEREDTITPASLGLSIAEDETIVAAIQTAMVTAQVKRHGESLRPCPHCAGPRTRRGTTPRSSLGLWPGADARTPAPPVGLPSFRGPRADYCHQTVDRDDGTALILCSLLPS
jgi:hypothetical protein